MTLPDLIAFSMNLIGPDAIDVLSAASLVASHVAHLDSVTTHFLADTTSSVLASIPELPGSSSGATGAGDGTGTGGATPPSAGTNGQQPSPGPLEMLFQFAPFILIIAVFWFLMIAPRRKEQKQREAMLSALTRGDRVTTIGGIMGTVVDVADDHVTVKVDETSNTKMRFTRAAINAVTREKTDKAKA